MNKQLVYNKLFNKPTKLKSKKVNLSDFSNYVKELQDLRDKFIHASNEMESLAIELEFKEKEMLDYKENYMNILADYSLEVEERLNELGIDYLPDEWQREFDRLKNDMPEVESIKGIVDLVKNQFR